jgi:myo-inositol-1(or 4)-monophosphatase
MKHEAHSHGIPEAEMESIGQLAFELATLAGAEIVSALGSLFTVRYKSVATDSELWRDPVSEVDQRIESKLRERLAKRFPSHDVIGEEMQIEGRGSECVWAVDPIDGTTNFVNGFPMFAASIGVLHKGYPVAGAVWCSASHALRAGVYHAIVGGKLRFEGDDVTPKINPAVRSGLAGVPVAAPEDAAWETRKTGSAAIECAMVGAGLLRVARFATPNIWDVAGGLALVRTAGGVIRQSDGKNWIPFEKFDASSESKAGLRGWHRPLIIGTPRAVEQMCAARAA